ncbi:MAG: Glycosyltransferase [Bacteroidetes bacterium HLUCCA01]|nr:MAG: Glycosyltransferase [Bacteroidetes bacterium HLUCCA01]
MRTENDGLKRILLVVSSLARSGPGVQLLSLVRGMRGEVAVDVVELSAGGSSSETDAFSESDALVASAPSGKGSPRTERVYSDSLRPDFIAAGAQVHGFDPQGLAFWREGRAAFRSLLDRLKPDVVQSAGIRADWLVGGLPAGVVSARISVMHNIPWQDYRYTYGPIPSAVMQRVQRRAWSRMDRVVCVSEHVRDTVSARWPELPLVAIPNGVDTARFSGVGAGTPAPSDAAENSRTSAGTSGEGVRFLCMDALTPLKDPLTLVRAFWQVRRHFPDAGVQLVLAGEGRLRDLCRTEAERLGLSVVEAASPGALDGSDSTTALPDMVRSPGSTSPDTTAGTPQPGAASSSDASDSAHDPAAVRGADVVLGSPSSQPEDWYRRADVLVSGSNTEGFQLTVAEGVSAGLLPVLSRIGVRHELFAGHEDLTGGLLFRIADAPEAAKCMGRAVERVLSARKSGDPAWEQLAADIRKRYSQERMGDDYLALYRELLADG